MSYKYSCLILSILTPTQMLIAGEVESNLTELSSIQLKATSKSSETSKGHVIRQNELLEGATSIGNALNGQPGVYAAQYTGGASRPVMRGLDGTRVKITENGGDALDLSSLSPDHAVTVDPNSAQEIQVLRGSESLLYGAGFVGGLVNVVDEKIPTTIPDHGYEGRISTRYNTGNDEMLYSGNTTFALGNQVAMRIAGLTRDANSYILPHDLQTTDRRQESTFSRSHNYNTGLSWIYDRGFTGLSYSERHDSYGIPSSNSAYGACELNESKTGFTTASCGNAVEDEDSVAPWIKLKEKRYGLKTELSRPFAGFSKLSAQAMYTDYQHQEMDGDIADTTFKSRGVDTKLMLDSEPLLGWTGQLGAQYTKQKLHIDSDEPIVAPNTTQRYSLFALQEKTIDNVHLQVSSRIDHQNIDTQKIESNPNVKDFSGTAFSLSGTADWNFLPHYKWSLTASHQERLPTAQELYSNGRDMAYNTYSLGNHDLKTEKSNNIELGFHFQNDHLKYHVSIYHNWFNHFIYANVLDRYEEFRLIQYTQSKARFYGIEADGEYVLSPRYTLGLFGDYVRGKIAQEGNAPRVPSGRIGTRIHGQFSDSYTGSAEYYHVFKQDKITSYERIGQSYNMLNLGLSYNRLLLSGVDSRIYVKVNNLLDSKIYQHESFLSYVPQIGRNFTIGVDFNF